MRLQGLALVVVALAVRPWGSAATSARPVSHPSVRRSTGSHLLRWEQEMQRVQTLVALINLTEKDKAFRTEQKFSGFASYMKAGNGPTAQNLAMLELHQDGKQDILAEIRLLGHASLTRSCLRKRKIRAHELPRPKPGQVADDNPVVPIRMKALSAPGGMTSAWLGKTIYIYSRHSAARRARPG